MATDDWLIRPYKYPSTFGGYLAFQTWSDFHLWETLLNDTYGLEAIIEFGTSYGGFSLYLLMQATIRGLEFHTFDYRYCDQAPLEDLWDKPTERFQIAPLIRPNMKIVDLLDHPASEVLEIVDGRRVVLFCDNGNKPREVHLYSPALFPGSLLVVHDWGAEIGPEHIPDGFDEMYGDICDEIGSMSRVFRKR